MQISSEPESCHGGRTLRIPSVPGRLALCLLASLTCLLSASPRFLLPLAVGATLYGVIFTPRRRLLWSWAGLTALGCITWTSTTILFLLWPSMADWASDFNAAAPVFRLWIVANAVMVLTIGMNSNELFRTVTVLPLPYVLKLPFLIIIRFLPSFVNEARLLAEAIQLRFVGRGILGWLFQPVQAWRVLFLPVVVRILRTGDELAMAAELKGISPQSFPTDGCRLLNGFDCAMIGCWLFLTAVAMAHYWVSHVGS